MGAVYLLTLRQLSGRWRIVIMSILAAMPVLISGIMLSSSNAPSLRDFEGTVLSAMLAGSIAPLIVLAIAAAAFAIELEDRTLADLTAVMSVTASVVVGVALYASAFIWLGLMTTQAIGVGLLYIVLWEGFFARYVSGVRLLSIRYHSIGLMHGLDERRFVGTHLSLGVTIVVAVVVFVGFAMLAIRRLRRMDVP